MAADGDPSADATFVMIPWAEFRMDYERLLLIFASQHLWLLCERRLAQLRGLFDAHCALNSAAEEHELSSASVPAAVANAAPSATAALAGALVPAPEPAVVSEPVRVDNCVQLARSLAPSRLLSFFKQKLQASNAEPELSEVAPAKSLSDLASQLVGRPVRPSDLTVDADAPVSAASGLAGVFSRTSNHVRGRFLAEATRMSLELLDATDAASGSEVYAEYRLPLHAESGAWVDLARWVAEFGVASARCRWVLQLPQAAYGGLKESACLSVS